MIDRIRSAADSNHIEALNVLGIMYLKGEGCDQDAALAAHCFQSAADKGSVDALVNMGSLYELGAAGWKKDPKLAAQWYQKAADQNNDRALNNLGCLFIHGVGVEKNIVTAVELLSRSATQGNVNALYNLGVYYEVLLIQYLVILNTLDEWRCGRSGSVICSSSGKRHGEAYF